MNLVMLDKNRTKTKPNLNQKVNIDCALAIELPIDMNSFRTTQMILVTIWIKLIAHTTEYSSKYQIDLIVVIPMTYLLLHKTAL